MTIGFVPTTYNVKEGSSVHLGIEKRGDTEEALLGTVTSTDGTAQGLYILCDRPRGKVYQMLAQLH